ncbi:hypothetical protein [Pseudomonas viridiflava]|uniref:hypothetical protein n=1 Tax=Pseudomonas viridiflava TaxID=33069 RepID=UPI0013C2CD56|nr:hypothetical protein [Pseudomonas viridiflava]
MKTLRGASRSFPESAGYMPLTIKKFLWGIAVFSRWTKATSLPKDDRGTRKGRQRYLAGADDHDPRMSGDHARMRNPDGQLHPLVLVIGLIAASRFLARAAAGFDAISDTP